MEAIFISDDRTINYIPSGGDIEAGQVVVLNDLVSVAKRKIKDGTLGALYVVGIYNFPKSVGASTAIEQGKKIYWDNTSRKATKDDGGGNNIYIGKSVDEAADESGQVKVRLDQ